MKFGLPSVPILGAQGTKEHSQIPRAPLGNLPRRGDDDALLPPLVAQGGGEEPGAGSYEVMLRSRSRDRHRIWECDFQTSFLSLLPLEPISPFHTKGPCQKSKTLKGMASQAMI